jgi:heptosyltransferase II
VAHLVFQTAFPGDLFLSIPLLKRIKEWDIKTPLVLACRPGLGEFFLEYGLCDEIIKVDKRGEGDSALAQLQAREWDYVFVPHESVRTALWMRRLRAKHKVGFRKWWNGWIYDRRVVKPADFPDALRQLSLLTAVDSRLAEMFGDEDVQGLRNLAEQNNVDFSSPKIPEWASMNVIPSRSWGPYGAQKIREPQCAGATRAGAGEKSEKLIFLAPGSVWATKRWTLKGYTELARMLVERGYQVELVGSPAERALCEEIARAVPQAKNRAGQTTMTDLVKRCHARGKRRGITDGCDLWTYRFAPGFSSLAKSGDRRAERIEVPAVW